MKSLTSLVFLCTVLWQHPGLAESEPGGPTDGRIPIAFRPQVPYSANSDISDAIRQQCGLNDAMVASIQKYAREFKLPLVSDDPAPGQPVRRLTADITHATPGLYAFIHWHTRPATLTVRYRLAEGEDVILDTSRTCSSRKAGFLGLDGRACKKLDECVDEQGAYIGKWISNRLYR